MTDRRSLLRAASAAVRISEARPCTAQKGAIAGSCISTYPRKILQGKAQQEKNLVEKNLVEKNLVEKNLVEKILVEKILVENFLVYRGTSSLAEKQRLMNLKQGFQPQKNCNGRRRVGKTALLREALKSVDKERRKLYPAYT